MDIGYLVEIGERAKWWVTSAKQGNGAEFMRDGDTETYWQSDGHQPHLIDIEFNQRIQIVVITLECVFQHLVFDFRSCMSILISSVMRATHRVESPSVPAAPTLI